MYCSKSCVVLRNNFLALSFCNAFKLLYIKADRGEDVVEQTDLVLWSILKKTRRRRRDHLLQFIKLRQPAVCEVRKLLEYKRLIFTVCH